MALIYSERFVNTSAPGVWVSYVVPAGKRAVLRCVTANNPNSAAGDFYAHVQGVYVVVGPLQAHSSRVEGELRVVVYAGESLGLFVATTGMGGSMSGYLFDDASGRGAPDVEYDLELPQPPVLAPT